MKAEGAKARKKEKIRKRKKRKCMGVWQEPYSDG